MYFCDRIKVNPDSITQVSEFKIYSSPYNHHLALYKSTVTLPTDQQEMIHLRSTKESRKSASTNSCGIKN